MPTSADRVKEFASRVKAAEDARQLAIENLSAVVRELNELF